MESSRHTRRVAVLGAGNMGGAVALGFVSCRRS